jgi:hypothetical protein
MSKETSNKSVLEEAILEYKQILEVAKNQLAENHSKEVKSMMESLISENKKVSDNKEPEKVIKEEFQNETINTSAQEPLVGAPEIDMRAASMKEVEEAFDAASADDEFNVVASDNNGDFTLNDIESEVNEVMAEIQAAEQAAVESPQVSAPIQQAPAMAQPIAQIPVAPEQIQEVDPFIKMKQMHEEMGKMLETLEAEKLEKNLKENFHSKMTEMWGEGYEQQLGTNECGKMYETWKARATGEESKKEDVSEVTAPVSEVAAPVEESHGVTLSHNKKVGQESQPRLDNGKDYAKNKVRLALQKENAEKIQKRIDTLSNENFKLIKEAVKAKADYEEIVKLCESYKEALVKYRTQLTEMALLNQNIGNVNNILVSENLALSYNDKKNIIEKFKKVGNVNESDELYKTLIKEYTETKKTLQESIEEKVNGAVIEPSTSQMIQESVTKTEVNPHQQQIDKMLKISAYNYTK